MIKYVLKRLLAGVLTIVVLITIAFFLMHAMPGSPFSQEEQKKLTAEGLAKLKAKYGLDLPVWEQYVTYWRGSSGLTLATLSSGRIPPPMRSSSTTSRSRPRWAASRWWWRF
jgi:ABC-type dipeptide/oligopeptide/nickel transport system permease component